MGLAFLAMPFLSSALASGLKVVRQDGGVTATLNGLSFPSSLTRELKSGLTTHILIHFVLLENGTEAEHRDIDVAVRYDLWDENFPMTETADRTVLRQQVFLTLDQVTTFLGNITVPRVFATARFSPGRAYELSAQVLLNPIEKERMESLKRWVADNSASEKPSNPASTAPLGQGPNAPPAATRPQSMFDRIFQQYAAGLDYSAVWRQNLTFGPFTLQDLSRDRE
jgi:hypothetical protein